MAKRHVDGLAPFPAWLPGMTVILVWKNYFQRARSPVAFDPDDPLPVIVAVENSGYPGCSNPLKLRAAKKVRFTIAALRPGSSFSTPGASPLAITACALVSASRRGTVPVNLAAPVLYSEPTEGGTEAYPGHLRIFPAYDNALIDRNPSPMVTLTQSLSQAGHLGGTSRSRRKAAAARRNGALGGRPRKVQMVTSWPHSIYTGSVLRILPTLPSNSFGGCLTDPPYELGFMGKRWDSSGVAFKVSVWREVYRVLKPGAYLLAFGGAKTFHRLTSVLEKAGFEIRDHIMWLQGQGFPKNKASLKPAYEPVILARKQGSKVKPLNIDDCRIPIYADDLKAFERLKGFNNTRSIGGTAAYGGGEVIDRGEYDGTKGRWPANVILDEDSSNLLGEPARFFYCAKASRKERDAGLDDFVKIPGGERTTAKGFLADAARGSRSRPVRNVHPTVKPLDLCRHLASLILPNGTRRLLVPFSGSGSEMIGGIQAGWDEVTGVELSAEYAEIASARIKQCLSHP
jgi:DNA modification methylase